MKISLLAIIGLLILLVGCSQVSQQPTPESTQQPTPSGQPEWIYKLIDQFSSEPVGNPQQSIWRYDYGGHVVYFIPAQCCDMFSTLYDESGNVICAPDGGIDGKGDGKCPDFASQRTNEQLIWKDARPR